MTTAIERPAWAGLLILVLVAAACAPRFAPPGPYAEGGGPGPELAAERFLTEDGLALPLRAWRPEGEPEAVILALHGFNDYGQAFALPAPAFTAAGIALYAYDQRGFGAAPHSGLWAGQEALVDDALTAARLLKARHPDKPLYLMGESMGGAVAALALARPEPPPVEGAVLIAPAVWGRDTMGFVPRVSLWLARRLVPGLTPSGGDLEIQASDNIEMLRALARDPLVIKETRIDAVAGLVDLMDAALAAAPEIDQPLLVLYGDKDEVIPEEPVLRFWEALPEAARERQHLITYDEGWHMLLRDLQAETVIADVIAWVESGAETVPSDQASLAPGRGAAYLDVARGAAIE